MIAPPDARAERAVREVAAHLSMMEEASILDDGEAYEASSLMASLAAMRLLNILVDARLSAEVSRG